MGYSEDICFPVLETERSKTMGLARWVSLLRPLLLAAGPAILCVFAWPLLCVCVCLGRGMERRERERERKGGTSTLGSPPPLRSLILLDPIGSG